MLKAKQTGRSPRSHSAPVPDTLRIPLETPGPTLVVPAMNGAYDCGMKNSNAFRVGRACALVAAATLRFNSAEAQSGTIVQPGNAPGSSATALTSAPVDAADSAELARTRYRAARDLLAHGDTPGALKALHSAAQAFPAQPVYAMSLWETAALSRNTAMAMAALTISNDNGIPLDIDARARALFPDTGSFTALYARQAQLSQAINNGSVFRTLSDARLFPEGITYDARNGTLYVTSVQHRSAVAITRDGVERTLAANAPRDIGGLYGIAIDTSRNKLWATSAQSPATKSWNVADSTLSALIEIDVRSGAIGKRYALTGTSLPPSPGDIALAGNGDVFVGDGQAGVIWWLKRGDSAVRVLRNRLYRSPQGMVASDDGRYLWIADYSHGLLRTELATGETIRVAPVRGITTVGIDGLVRHGNKFVAVQNASTPGQVLQFELDETGSKMLSASVIDRNKIGVSPTGGVMVGDDYVYISNTLWDKVGPDGSLPADAARSPVLLRVPIRTRP